MELALGNPLHLMQEVLGQSSVTMYSISGLPKVTSKEIYMYDCIFTCFPSLKNYEDTIVPWQQDLLQLPCPGLGKMSRGCIALRSAMIWPCNARFGVFSFRCKRDLMTMMSQ